MKIYSTVGKIFISKI